MSDPEDNGSKWRRRTIGAESVDATVDCVPERVIVTRSKHAVGERDLGPIHCEIVDDLDGDLDACFTEKIRTTLIDKGHRVVGDPESKSGAPTVIANLLRDTTGLLAQPCEAR